MKTVMITLALLMSAPAVGQQVYRVRTNTCAEYRGTWEPADAISSWREEALVRCEVDENEPKFAQCSVNLGGGKSLNFIATKVVEGGFVKWLGFAPDDQKMCFELRCRTLSTCIGFRVWNDETGAGFQCAKL